MSKTYPAGLLASAALGFGLGLGSGLAATYNPTVVTAPQWTSLLARTSGWTGGDGIFSVPLSGYKGPDHAAGGKTLFLFSDTFVGNVDSTGARKNAVMIHNSLAVLDGAEPDPAKIHFLWGKNDKGAAITPFSPNTPATAGKNYWYWLQDGYYHRGFVYSLPLIITASTGGLGFKEVGIGLLKIPIGADGEPDLAGTLQKDTPLFHTDSARTFYFGNGILPNTAEAGAPNPDGYVYVYGRNSLYVARVLPDDFEDFSKWRFWDGKAWTADIAASASLGLGGPELSVTPVAQGSLKGKFLLVSMSVEPNVFVRVGDSPVGPFGNRINIYSAPEWNATGPVYTYNAKAHPSLSSDGDWLVTYNVNTPDWNLNLSNADIYHPRFLKLRFDPPGSAILDAEFRHPAPSRRAGLFFPEGQAMTVLGLFPTGVGTFRSVSMDGRLKPLLNR